MMKAFILKVDLVKDYDGVDLSFLRFILLQIGLPYEVTYWIMGWISSAIFVFFVNGSPTTF